MNTRVNAPSLYHYTSNAGIIGMFSKQELWFSDVRFLNDSREYKQSCDILERYIRKYASNYRTLWIERGCKEDQFDKMVANLIDGCKYDALYSRGKWKGNPFIFSLSEKRDALDQWRAYGNGEYCIKFDAEKLQQNTRVQLLKVTYSSEKNGEENEDTELLRVISEYFTRYVRSVRDDGSIDPDIYHNGLEEIVVNLLRGNFFIKHKDYGFHNEKEWRLVCYVQSKEKNLFFSSGGRYPKPRIKIKLFEDQFDFVEAIKEIVCGPGLDIELCRNSINMLRAPLLVPYKHSAFSIEPSIIPYRPN